MRKLTRHKKKLLGYYVNHSGNAVNYEDEFEYCLPIEVEILEKHAEDLETENKRLREEVAALEARCKRYEEALRDIWCENPMRNGEDCTFCKVCIAKRTLEQREE